MILAFELVWTGTAHAVTNSAMLQTIIAAFPGQTIRVFADRSHVQELEADTALITHKTVSFQPVVISRHFLSRPHVVSVRRGLREFRIMAHAIAPVPAGEPCLVVLLSATPTMIFGAHLLSRLTRRDIRIQVGLHGNLNDAFGWRPRNPLTRAIDLHAALAWDTGATTRFLVLEKAIRATLSQRILVAGRTTDVLPLPINEGEAAEAVSGAVLGRPVRIGLVGQGTAAKGAGTFLSLASDFRRAMPDDVHFHLVGHPGQGRDPKPFDVLNDPKPYPILTRPMFLERLKRLHYVCLPLDISYYGLAASGALIDAITWLKPIIATPVPIVTDLFDSFGDIGEICATEAEMHGAIERLVRTPDQARYDRQVENLRRIRSERMPQVLAERYRQLVIDGFPGLFGTRQVHG